MFSFIKHLFYTSSFKEVTILFLVSEKCCENSAAVDALLAFQVSEYLKCMINSVLYLMSCDEKYPIVTWYRNQICPQKINIKISYIYIMQYHDFLCNLLFPAFLCTGLLLLPCNFRHRLPLLPRN